MLLGGAKGGGGGSSVEDMVEIFMMVKNFMPLSSA